MPSVVATIEIGEPRTGLWCDTCLLPSLVEVDGYLMSPSGLSYLCTARMCAGCGFYEHDRRR